MPPDDFGEGVLRIFPRELPQQIQIACHSFESISPPLREIRQNCLVSARKQLYFRGFVAQFNGTMTRRFYKWFVLPTAFFLSAQISARADDALAKSAILENDTLYLRVGEVGKNLPEEIQSAQNALAATNKIAGTVLDLRFAGGDDLDSEKTTENLFASQKLPLAILINAETRGAAIELAKDLRKAKAGLIFGEAAKDLQPDISVSVKADDEKKFLENPFGTLTQNETNSATSTNSFLSFVDHTTEADLVREKIKDGDQDENSAQTPATEPQKPFIRDPVLARAVDLIKGLAVVRQSHL
jgi:hypothetical protein